MTLPGEVHVPESAMLAHDFQNTRTDAGGYIVTATGDRTGRVSVRVASRRSGEEHSAIGLRTGVAVYSTSCLGSLDISELAGGEIMGGRTTPNDTHSAYRLQASEVGRLNKDGKRGGKDFGDGECECNWNLSCLRAHTKEDFQYLAAFLALPSHRYHHPTIASGSILAGIEIIDRGGL
ncbi:hypothetical protein Tco_0162531 [Tanacetum coccineum]